MPNTQHSEPEAEMIALSPYIWLSYTGEVPSAIINEADGWEAFSNYMPNVWCKDPRTDMVIPYWAPEDIFELLHYARDDVITRCPAFAAQWLRERRMVAQASPLNAPAAIAQHMEDLRKNKYTVLRGLYPKVVLQAMTERMRSLEEGGKLFQCKQVLERSANHNDPIMRYFHLQITKYLNRLMPDKIKASYVYSVIYHEAAVLKRHVDRPQCLWNLSVVLGTVPDVTMETTWPIYLEIDNKAVEVRLLPGDGVLYSGTDIYHWRDAQPAGMESVVSFYHFVPHDFTDKLN